MKGYSLFLAAVLLSCMLGPVGADVVIDTVVVGDPGNSAVISGKYSESVFGWGIARMCGAVSYTYNIGKYEVTAGQYTAFLNAVAKTDTHGLYNEYMWDDTAVNPENFGCRIQRTGESGGYVYSVASDWANRPVNYVSYWDACRFANWLHNGQSAGEQDATTTERGAYTLDGYNGVDGGEIERNSDWKWALTSEDEWFKAAYYAPWWHIYGGGYWTYPTGSIDAMGRDLADESGNNANYWDNGYLIDDPYYRTEAGEFQNSMSDYGTFDQAGNVWEWNETLYWHFPGYASARCIRGGSYWDSAIFLRSEARSYDGPAVETALYGFRVSSSAVPEPGSIFVVGAGLVSLLGLRNRKK